MKIRKDYILFLFLLVIIVFTAYILINSGHRSAPTVVDARPSYLLEPIPHLEELEVIINNPKFQEMKYIQSFFDPVLVEKKGRVNPFMPFVLEKKE